MSIMDNIEQYCIDRKPLSPKERQVFLEEVGYLCPLCGTSLIKRGRSKTANIFEIAHIYPNSPTTNELKVLYNVERCGRYSEDPENLIALCSNCHTLYDKDKNVEEYNKLLALKKRLFSQRLAKFDLSNISIECEIADVLDAIGNLDSDNFLSIKQIDYSILRIDEKVEAKYFPLRHKIRSNVAQYYSFVETEFKNIDSNKSKKFDTICCEIRTAYLKCISNQCEQEVAFDSLVDWLSSKTQGNNIACEIIISFFVQNCQIYDKTTQ